MTPALMKHLEGEGQRERNTKTNKITGNYKSCGRNQLGAETENRKCRGDLF